MRSTHVAKLVFETNLNYPVVRDLEHSCVIASTIANRLSFMLGPAQFSADCGLAKEPQFLHVDRCSRELTQFAT